MIYKRKNHSNLIRNFFLTIVFGLSLFFFYPNSSLKSFADEKELLEIEDYFNSIRTVKSDFVQESYTNVISTGIFFLKKPGKFRFSYNPPNELEVVSHLQAVLIFDPKSSGTGPLTYPLSYTPLGFLIKNDLNSLISENGESFELDDLIFLKIRNPQYQLSIEFNKNPVSIIGWEFKNKMGEIIRITLKDIRKNNYISDEIFKTEKDYERFKK